MHETISTTETFQLSAPRRPTDGAFLVAAQTALTDSAQPVRRRAYLLRRNPADSAWRLAVVTFVVVAILIRVGAAMAAAGPTAPAPPDAPPPCAAVHYVVDSAEGPAGAVASVQEAFSRLSDATGVNFLYDGDNHARRRGPRPGRGRAPNRCSSPGWAATPACGATTPRTWASRRCRGPTPARSTVASCISTPLTRCPSPSTTATAGVGCSCTNLAT